MAMAVHYPSSQENRQATMQTETTPYSNLTSSHNDVYAVHYPYSIEDGEAERKAEEAHG